MPLRRFLAIYALNFFRIEYRTVATAWFTTLTTRRMNSVAELMLISSVSTLCLSPFIGRLVNRVSRKKVMLCMAQVCVMLCGLIAIGLLPFTRIVDAFAVLAFVTAVLSATSLLAGGAIDYFLRTFIREKERPRQLASINIVIQIALIAGTCAAGTAASLVTMEAGFLILSILSALTALLCLLFLPDLHVGQRVEVTQPGLGYFRA
ncbi:hypothetical protein BUMB_05070c [Candidatus Paraburkholderia calva]|nr:hypothetical protein BUMB_05070c [Candidatus Paraburkholderia calva]